MPKTKKSKKVLKSVRVDRPRARRVRVKRDSAGEWRYTVQGGNWQVIDAPEEGFKRRKTALKRVAERWPNAEEVIIEE